MRHARAARAWKTCRSLAARRRRTPHSSPEGCHRAPRTERAATSAAGMSRAASIPRPARQIGGTAGRRASAPMSSSTQTKTTQWDYLVPGTHRESVSVSVIPVEDLAAGDPHLTTSPLSERPSRVAGEGPSLVGRRSTSGAGESAHSCPRLAPAPLAALPSRQLTAPALVRQEICVPARPHVGLAWSQPDLHDGRLMAF